MKICADANILFAREAFAQFGDVNLVDGRTISRDQLDDVTMLLVRSVTKVNRELLEGTSVKFVASATIGTDHVDTAYLRENNIGFAHAPGSNANAVAEYVVSALVHLAKKKSISLSGMTIGIIGVGNVGTRVLHYAKLFGMRCLLCDPPKKDLTQSDMYVPLNTVLEQADIVTVHVPLSISGSCATQGMINSDFLSAMKKNAILVNTSRGAILDETALHTMRTKLGGVVLDVWNNEPVPHPTTIAVCDIATPHIAGYSYDGKLCGTAMIYDAACAFFFKERSWVPPVPVSEQLTLESRENKTRDIVSSAIMAAYPVMDDDARFRKILDIDISKRAEYFDKLRREYPKRLEFSHYYLNGDAKSHEQSLAFLLNMGFRVNLR